MNIYEQILIGIPSRSELILIIVGAVIAYVLWVFIKDVRTEMKRIKGEYH